MAKSVMFDSEVMATGFKIVSSLIDLSPHKRTTRKEVAEILNTQLGTDLWDEDSVRTAVRAGAFNVEGTREFYDVPGRFGGIREIDLDAQAEEEKKFAELTAKEEQKIQKRKIAAEKRKETWKAKKAQKAQKESGMSPLPEDSSVSIG